MKLRTRNVGVSDAIGPRDGDFLRIENAWAHVVISRSKQFDWREGGWIVTGYIKDRGGEVSFTSLRAALDYAWQSLAEYQEGRGD